MSREQVSPGEGKEICDWLFRGIEKKASLRPRAKKWEILEGLVERSVKV